MVEDDKSPFQPLQEEKEHGESGPVEDGVSVPAKKADNHNSKITIIPVGKRLALGDLKSQHMFEEILNTVKQHLAENPEIAQHIPAEQQEEIHNEIANHVANAANPPAEPESGGMLGGLLEKVEAAIGGNNPLAGAVEGGLVSSLAAKFGLSPAATGAIAGALPGLLQKVMHRPANA